MPIIVVAYERNSGTCVFENVYPSELGVHAALEQAHDYLTGEGLAVNLKAAEVPEDVLPQFLRLFNPTPPL